MPETMDKALVREVAAAANEALKEVADRFGLTLTQRGGSYAPHEGTFTPKFVFSLEDADARQFATYAALFGLSEHDLGREFRSGAKVFTICGLNPKAKRYPVIASGSDGKRYKFAAETVRARLA